MAIMPRVPVCLWGRVGGLKGAATCAGGYGIQVAVQRTRCKQSSRAYTATDRRYAMRMTPSPAADRDVRAAYGWPPNVVLSDVMNLMRLRLVNIVHRASYIIHRASCFMPCTSWIINMRLRLVDVVGL